MFIVSSSPLSPGKYTRTGPLLTPGLYACIVRVNIHVVRDNFHSLKTKRSKEEKKKKQKKKKERGREEGKNSAAVGHNFIQRVSSNVVIITLRGGREGGKEGRSGSENLSLLLVDKGEDKGKCR